MLKIPPDNSQVSPKTLVFKHKQKERKQFLSKAPRGLLIIPWQGKILTPSPFQLRNFQGNLDQIASKLGSREPVGKEKFYREIRIFWKGRLLIPSPQQLTAAKGDLNNLSLLLKVSRHQVHSLKQNSRKNGQIPPITSQIGGNSGTGSGNFPHSDPKTQNH